MKNKKFQYVIYRAVKGDAKQKNPLKSGFFLIEIMIALAVFASMAFLGARYHVCLIQQSKDTHDCLRAVNEASDCIGDGQATKKTMGHCTIERVVSDFVAPPQIQNQGFSVERLKNMKRVSVKVTWANERKHNRSIELQSVQMLQEGRV
jgi:hypothetical protein